MAMKFGGGKATDVDPAAKSAQQSAAGQLERAASDVSRSVMQLKRFVADNPNLQSLITEGDQLRAKVWDLAQKIDKA